MFASVMRALPQVRGHGTVSLWGNEFFLKLGCSPMAIAPMKSGGRIIVDTRSRTERYSFYSGRYDTEEIRFILSILPNAPQILDVGANVGFYAVPLAMICKRKCGKLHAFEPVPQNFRRLSENLAINQLSDFVVVHEIGLSNRSGRASITLREDFSGGSSTGNASIAIEDGKDQAFQTISIETKTLDELYGAGIIGNIDFIKLDIEGHELAFLEGGRSTLAATRPIIGIEINQWYYDRQGIHLVERLPKILPQGYSMFLITPHSSVPLRPLTAKTKLTGLANALLVPDEHSTRIAKLPSGGSNPC